MVKVGMIIETQWSVANVWRDSRDWREQNHEIQADKRFRLVRFMDDEI